ncbi:hypothetical protein M9Y10_019159 [Tritrichomonas musculus]|uniref:Uncharacterized protein n=1 Tax=Tritrichomonas musculus TaxID=1915356 RepID=A0ABR2HJL1_9EUKA
MPKYIATRWNTLCDVLEYVIQHMALIEKTIYKPIEKTDKETNKHESIEYITNRLETLEERLREHTNKYEHDLITIRTQFNYNINKINVIKDSLNSVFNVINQMLNQK